ncbi:hypothetical protein [Romboutsia lituseburensis]|uniref:hypothetical protein n=1 Tax=Romboutsia lituseburensis TaxID=1537 RepID=UPI00215B496F|nr:hypothetical protein [Romboutsia lituseburensis]MCR8744521.1 hypothetical protein [Romboutsia lituseburensis]
MSFFNDAYIFIRKSDKTINVFDLNKHILYNRLDSNLNNLYSDIIIDGDFSFADTWFDITDNDTIYGVINDKKGKLININITNDNFINTTIFKYDHYNYFIKFPYIKNLLGSNHIIYYVINKNKPTKLIHIYKQNNVYKKNIIDYINHNILTNFIITWNYNIPTIFYFKVVDNSEELFTSTFDLTRLKWSNPIQITNSKKNKIYLSVIQSKECVYHISYSEDNSGKYIYRYFSLHIDDYTFKTYNPNYLSSNIMCLFPSLVESNSILYAYWVEYYNLYTCKSYDFGATWSKPTLINYSSSKPVLIYGFKSNLKSDKKYNLSSFFTFKGCFDINAILPKY